MLKIGITGGIGSGKSTVCKVFEVLGIPVYYTDDKAKYLMQNDADLKTALSNEFGEEIFVKNKLQPKVLAAKVFNNKPALTKLNSLVHPVVFNDVVKWYKKHADKAYTLQEAALLIETGTYKRLDNLIVVHAPQAERIKRVVKRDGVIEEQVLARMKHQLPEAEKLKLADYVINNYDNQSIIEQVMPIHQELLELSKKKRAQ